MNGEIANTPNLIPSVKNCPKLAQRFIRFDKHGELTL